MDVSKLIAAATPRRVTVTVLGEDVTVREPSFLEWAAWINRDGEVTPEALSKLFRAVVIDADSGESALTEEQAAIFAKAPPRAIGPILDALAGLVGANSKNV